ncbi:MAG: MCE family protein [Ignavibacteria bacterium]|nr:MCE family protein [Ignavibacteria bacterium]MBT8380951.1 MCE family protein [Ignavibacteria bacterium]MBT8391869.1 MCE family protein [Ignavibacteria bacterium]NNJ52976.1 MCE family protein [Ignavibacteriaceae bacterium]NNL21451.1 MCE family protein [Ignavibacteriaceae bacterium]
MKGTLAGARLGIFIFIGSTLLVIGIFMLGNKEALFKPTFTVKAYFHNIEGLRNGAPVRLSGIDAGAVQDIKVVGDTVSLIEVSMRLLSEIEHFIRVDTQAEIQTEGLVGNKFVALKIGDSRSELVKDGGVILAKDPVSFADIISETQGIMGYTKEMTKDLAGVLSKINAGEGTIGKIFTDEALYYAATDLTKSADKSLKSITSELKAVTDQFNKLGKGVESVVRNVNTVVTGIDTLLYNVKQGKGVIGSLMVEGNSPDSSFSAILSNLTEITEESKTAAISLSENMEALKHNWLFKSYFEERGYWDAAEYENEIDRKTVELNEKIELLDRKIEELKSLEKKK